MGTPRFLGGGSLIWGGCGCGWGACGWGGVSALSFWDEVGVGVGGEEEAAILWGMGPLLACLRTL